MGWSDLQPGDVLLERQAEHLQRACRLCAVSALSSGDTKGHSDTGFERGWDYLRTIVVLLPLERWEPSPRGHSVPKAFSA